MDNKLRWIWNGNAPLRKRQRVAPPNKILLPKVNQKAKPTTKPKSKPAPLRKEVSPLMIRTISINKCLISPPFPLYLVSRAVLNLRTRTNHLKMKYL